MTRDEARIVINAATHTAMQCGVAIHDVIEILQCLKIDLCNHADHLELHKRVEESYVKANQNQMD
jgi:hypothetical protein